MSAKEVDLTKLHNVELILAKELKRICDENGIEYFLTAGSTLGAVRHGGFIPWDDDMDFGMLRDQYEKFLKIAPDKLGKEFFLQTWDTDQEYPAANAKLRLNGTHIVEEFSLDSKMHNGIFIDIFPFDNVPDDKSKIKMQAKILYLCRRVLWIKIGMGKNIANEGTKRFLQYHISRIVSALLPYSAVKNYYSRRLKKYNGKKTEKIVTEGTYSYDRESIMREWTESLKEISFEGIMFKTYEDTDAYLSSLYGDYMKLPPVEKRRGHVALNIDYGPYDNISGVE